MAHPDTTPPLATPGTSGRNRQIDAWRACACLAVVGVHTGVLGDIEGVHPIIAALGSWLKHGWLGVPVFFVISGYCLAGSLQKRARGGCRSMIHFWKDRLLRIFPTYWAAWLLACLLASTATLFNGLPAASAWPASPLDGLADLTLTNVWWQRPTQLSVSWSLDYEIGFYVLIGAALAWPSARGIHRLLVCGLITAVSHLPGAGHYLPVLGLWPQFACGIAVHTAATASFPRLLRILALSYPVSLCVAAIPGGVSSGWFAPACSLLLFLGLRFASRLPSPPELLSRLGQASYSIYLVHIPIMSPMLNLSKRFVAESDPLYVVIWAAHIIAGVLAGVIFYHAVEKRLERWRARAVFVPQTTLR